MMATKCLICDWILPTGNSAGSNLSKNKKSRSDVPIQFISDSKSKFVLTSSQYSILQKVLTLPNGLCKSELINGPYCRECFTNINNVCHCMSALENLQQSVLEFRKDFSSKMKASFEGVSDKSAGSRKRKSLPVGENTGFLPIRSMILEYLGSDKFPLTLTNQQSSSKPKHIHEIISSIDPNGSPNTEIDADMILRTTNGDMPRMSTPNARSGNKGKGAKRGKYKKSKASTKGKSLTKVVASLSPTKSVSSVGSNGGYICWYCSAKFSSDDSLKAHEQIHKGLKVCPICKKKFDRVSSLNRHMMTHGVKDTRSMKPCDVCNKRFPNKKLLEMHRSKEHKVGKPPTNKSGAPITPKVFRPGRCKICVRIVTDIHSHMKTQHPEIKAVSSNVNQGSAETTKPKPGPASRKKAAIETWDPVSVKKEYESETPPNNKETKYSEELSTKNKDSSPPNPTEVKNSNEIKTEPNVNGGRTRSTYPKGGQEQEENKTVTENIATSPNDDKIANNVAHRSDLEISPTRSPPFQIPVPALLATLPSPPQTQTSKYQFKNLLKIGDKP